MSEWKRRAVSFTTHLVKRVCDARGDFVYEITADYRTGFTDKMRIRNRMLDIMQPYSKSSGLLSKHESMALNI